MWYTTKTVIKFDIVNTLEKPRRAEGSLWRCGIKSAGIKKTAVNRRPSLYLNY